MALEWETVETPEATALQLTPAERARPVNRLIATLDAYPEVEEALAAEVEPWQNEVSSITLISFGTLSSAVTRDSTPQNVFAPGLC